MKSNNTQVGGDHYKSAYQHWDLVLTTQMGYLEGCATKYIARWRKKGGIEDLRKAQHYVQKLKDDVEQRAEIPCSLAAYRVREVEQFAKANSLPEFESVIIQIITIWRRPEDLDCALRAIGALIKTADDGADPSAAYVDQG